MGSALLILYFCLAAEPSCGELERSGEAHFFLDSCSQAAGAVEKIQSQSLFDRYEIRVISYKCLDER